MRNKYKTATRHIVEEVEESLKDITADCFVYDSDEVISEDSDEVISENSDDNEAEENETTTDGPHKCDGSSSSASLSCTSGLSAVTEFCLWKRQRALFGIILGFLPNQESSYRKVNTFERKFTASTVSDLYRTKVIPRT